MKYAVSLLLLLAVACNNKPETLAQDEIAKASLSEEQIKLYDSILKFVNDKLGCDSSNIRDCWIEHLTTQDSLLSINLSYDIPWTSEEQSQFLKRIDTSGSNLFWKAWSYHPASGDTSDYYYFLPRSAALKIWNRAAETDSTWKAIVDQCTAIHDVSPSLFVDIVNPNNTLIDDPKMRLFISLMYMTSRENFPNSPKSEIEDSEKP